MATRMHKNMGNDKSRYLYLAVLWSWIMMILTYSQSARNVVVVLCRGSIKHLLSYDKHISTFQWLFATQRKLPVSSQRFIIQKLYFYSDKIHTRLSWKGGGGFSNRAGQRATSSVNYFPCILTPWRLLPRDILLLLFAMEMRWPSICYFVLIIFLYFLQVSCTIISL